jgi:hypothetical protein
MISNFLGESLLFASPLGKFMFAQLHDLYKRQFYVIVTDSLEQVHSL